MEKLKENPIPEELRSDHLFLLVGTNPLPNWAAARLLLRPEGRLYLVHSPQTLAAAQRLAQFLQNEYNYVQPIYIGVQDSHSASQVETSIRRMLAEIKHGVVGLNYTGGTKVMAAHAHRVMDYVTIGLPKVIFSYLEAPSCMMRFDNLQDGFPVGLAKDTQLDLFNLFALHDEYELLNPQPMQATDAIPVAKELIKVHATPGSHNAWRDFCERELRYPYGRPTMRLGKNPRDIKGDTDARGARLAVGENLSAVAEALIDGGETGTKTLDDVMKGKRWNFQDAGELAKWLDGAWLEHYILKQVIDRKSDFKLTDYGRNFLVGLSRFNKLNRQGQLERYNFEIDVMAMRGYQLHVISCYSGRDQRKGTCKNKLFEVFTRARQLGGDEARAALVCCSGDPLTVEREVAHDWNLKDQVKVFGRKDLLTLGAELQQWFDAGAKE